MSKEPISIETLRVLLSCDPVAGTLTWRHRPLEYFAETEYPESQCARWNTRYAGKEACTVVLSSGYRQTSILLRKYYAHRVIWAMATGAWPPDQIDHINGVRTDNRIENLRAVTRSENMRNAAMPCTNTSGTMGVSWHKASGKWRATIKANGKCTHLGLFDDKDKAVAVRAAADIEYGYHENHGRMN